jgi:hypothetical protein
VPSNPLTKGRTWKRILPRLRHLQVETSMGSSLVVVTGVGPKHPLEVAAAEHEHPVQTLDPDRSHQGAQPRGLHLSHWLPIHSTGNEWSSFC